MKGLTDTHCHLSLDEFAGELEAVLARAHAAGVKRVIVPGIDLETSQRAVSIAEQYDGLFAAVGVHPHNAKVYSAEVEDQLRRLAHSPVVVAIGEIGLDFYRELTARDQQLSAFKEQLALASELDLPIIVHNREAEATLLEVLLEWAPGTKKGVLHAFSGSRAGADIALSSGFFIGVAGPLTYPKADELRQTIKDLPPDRLLLETDSPYLPPQPYRGKRNEPAYLPHVADELSRITGQTVERIVAETARNSENLFGRINGNANSSLQ